MALMKINTPFLLTKFFEVKKFSSMSNFAHLTNKTELLESNTSLKAINKSCNQKYEKKVPGLNLSKITNLVFEGGSVRGIGYLGALKQLAEYGFKANQIKRVAGTSAGGIATLAFGLNYDTNLMSKLLDEADIKNFLDSSDSASRTDNFLSIVESIKGKKYDEVFKASSLRNLAFKHIARILIINSTVTAILLYYTWPDTIVSPGLLERSYEKLKDFVTWDDSLLKRINDHIKLLSNKFQLALIFSVIFNLGFPSAYLWHQYRKLKNGNLEQTIKNFINLISPDVSKLIEILENGYGMYEGKRLLEWFEKIIQDKTGSPDTTFAELHKMKNGKNLFKDIYLYAIDVETRNEVCFSYETTPNMRLADAVRSSMSIPIVFKPHKCWNGIKDSIYIDGGLLNNYPIQQFDNIKYISDTPKKNKSKLFFKNTETLGFKIDTKEEVKMFKSGNPSAIKFDNLQSYVSSIIYTMFKHQDSRHLRDKEAFRTIYIEDEGVDTLDFHLNNKQKEALINSGAKAVNEFIQEYGYFEQNKSANEDPLIYRP